MTDSSHRLPAPGSVPLAGFALVYAVLGFVGRATAIDHSSFALVWPAAGVAVLWFLVRGAGPRSVDSLVLAACVLGVNRATGTPLEQALVLTATALIQTLLTAGLLRRWTPELWGCGGHRALDSSRLLTRYVASTVLGTGAGALAGTLVLTALGQDIQTVGGLLWFGRNVCSVLTLTTLGLLVGHRFTTPRPRRPVIGSGRVELFGAALFTAAMFALPFVFDDLPLAFPLLAASAWVGLRFPTLLGSAHATLLGAGTVALTLNHVGPFARVDSPEVGALLAQFYVATIVVTTLALSTGRDERELLTGELRRTEGEAVYQASLRDAILGSMTDAVLVVDEHGHVLVHNGAAGSVLGLDADASVGDMLAALGTGRDGRPLPEEEWPSSLALRGEPVRDAEVLLRSPGRPDRVVSVSAVGLTPDGKGGSARALLLLRDVTSEHAHREELSAFAGVVAHDLRNPLAAIHGWTEMIAEELEAGDLDPQLAREFTSRVRSSSGRMRTLIQDLLAHATSSSRELRPVRLDPALLVTEVAAARQVGGAVNCGELPIVRADPVLVRQVVDNLIGNALKYVAPGEDARVEVTGWRTGRLVTISVADHGIGLPEGEHERVFDDFHRVHHRDYEGSGLGLSICRRIVSRHGGTITARDNPAGTGTVFEFTLPAG